MSYEVTSAVAAIIEDAAGRVLLCQQAGGHQLWGLPGGRVRLDANYLYNPSCAYDDRWACPLAPPENRVDVSLRAGERAYH